MMKIKAVTFIHNENDAQQMVGFSVPKTKTEALARGHKIIRDEYKLKGTKHFRTNTANPKDLTYDVYRGKTLIGWFELQAE
jgi:hypothetical protein